MFVLRLVVSRVPCPCSPCCWSRSSSSRCSRCYRATSRRASSAATPASPPRCGRNCTSRPRAATLSRLARWHPARRLRRGADQLAPRDRDPGATDLQHPRPLGGRVPPLSAAGAHPGAEAMPGRPARPRAFGDHTGPAVDPGLPARDAAADRVITVRSSQRCRWWTRAPASRNICAPLPCPR